MLENISIFKDLNIGNTLKIPPDCRHEVERGYAQPKRSIFLLLLPFLLAAFFSIQAHDIQYLVTKAQIQIL